MPHSDDVKLNNTDTVDSKTSKKSSGAPFWAAMAILVVLLILSIIVLAARLYDFAKLDDRELMLKSNLDAEVDLFSIIYKNSTGEITVIGADGEKVVAPGTRIDYTVRLRNKDKVAIDYDVVPTAKFSSEHEIPILVRLLDSEENYIAGDAKTWITVEELNGITSQGTLRRDESAEYTFQWKWPFESGDDAYDTFLGNETITQDISIEIAFAVYAEANTDMHVNGGFVPSGRAAILLCLIFFILLLAAIILLILYKLSKIAFVDVMKLDASFAVGETVTLDALKQKALAGDKTERLRITAKKEAVVSHALTVEADSISKVADAAIRAAGGRVIIKNEKAK